MVGRPVEHLQSLQHVLGAVQEVATALDDADEGDDEERQDLHHGANLPHPAGQEDVALCDVPVEHFRDEAGLEGDHGHDQESNRENLETQFYTDYIKIVSSKHMKFSVNENR